MFVKLQVWLHFYAEVRGLVNAFKRTISEGALPSCCWSFAKCDNFTPISVERHFPLPRQFVQRVNICLEAEPISIIVHLWVKISSAYKLTPHVTISGKSFMYIRNNVGPSTEPCGTPEVTDRSGDSVPRTATLWLLWARKLWIQFTMFGFMPSIRRIFCMSKLWGTLSNAFRKSRTTPCTAEPFSIDLAKSWYVAHNWVLHRSPFLNPCCRLYSILSSVSLR